MVYILYMTMITTVIVIGRVCYYLGHNKGYDLGFRRGAEKIIEEWKQYNHDDNNWEK